MSERIDRNTMTCWSAMETREAIKFWLVAGSMAILLTFLPFGDVNSLTGSYWTFGQPVHTFQLKVGYSDRGDTATTVRLLVWSWGNVIVNLTIWTVLAIGIVVAMGRISRGSVAKETRWNIASSVFGALTVCVLVVNDLRCWGTWACPAYFLWGASDRDRMLAQIIGASIVVPLLGAIVAIRVLRATRGGSRRIGVLIVSTLVSIILLGLLANYLGGRLELH